MPSRGDSNDKRAPFWFSYSSIKGNLHICTYFTAEVKVMMRKRPNSQHGWDNNNIEKNIQSLMHVRDNSNKRRPRCWLRLNSQHGWSNNTIGNIQSLMRV